MVISRVHTNSHEVQFMLYFLKYKIGAGHNNFIFLFLECLTWEIILFCPITNVQYVG